MWSCGQPLELTETILSTIILTVTSLLVAFSMVKLSVMIGEIDSLVVDKLKLGCLALILNK
jgi:hypothetical protein